MVNLPPLLARALPLLDAFEAAGHTIHFVGGCVRDLLLGASIHDVDLATSARPEDSAAVLSSIGLRPLMVGARFGTVAAHFRGETYEITTYRCAEVYPEHGRHPVVSFGDRIEDDLERRDLSINAMAMTSRGELIDPFGGQRALTERRLEVPGGGYDATISIFHDDPLRILRVARFLARLGFDPTEDTTLAAAACVQDLRTISAERVRMELEKTLAAPCCDRGLLWLDRIGALRVVLPDVPSVDAGWLAAAVARAREAALGWSVVASRLDLPEAPAPPRGAPRASADAARAAAVHLQRLFRLSSTEMQRIACVGCPELTREVLGGPVEMERLRRWDDAAGGHALDQLRLLIVLAPDDPALAADVERWSRALEEARAAGPVTPVLPHRLGNAIVAQHPKLVGARLGAAIAALRDAIFRGELPNPPSMEASLRFVAGWIAWAEAAAPSDDEANPRVAPED